MSPLKPASKFQLTGGHLCLDFADTIDNRGSENEIDLVEGYEDLVAFVEQAGELSSASAQQLIRAASCDRVEADKVLNHARTLRELIFRIFSRTASGRRPDPEAIDELNKFLREAGCHRALVPGEEHFQWIWAGSLDTLERVLWPISLAAGELLASEDLVNVRQCASETCSWLFLDKSKSHSRRWCEMKTCGNRQKARRFYQARKRARNSS